MYEIGEDESQAVARVIRSRQLCRYRVGEDGECDIFERRLCEKVGAKYALAVNSGTSALVCSLVACDVGPGDEVIVPAYTFMATAMAVLAVGAIPVVADIDDSLTLDSRSVENKINSRTKAIIPVHMMGLPCDMISLMQLSVQYGLKIVEDACQSFGGSYKGTALGTMGNVGCFSFNHYKIISAGEDGALVNNDPDIYQKSIIQHDVSIIFDVGCPLRQRAIAASLSPFVGSNFRCSEITGAILREQLQRIDSILQRLRARKKAMQEVLRGSSHYQLAPIHCPDGDSGLVIMLRVSDEDRVPLLMQKLRANHVPATTPIDSAGHVYCSWWPVITKHGALHPKMNPYNRTEYTYDYGKGTCAKTIKILSQTIAIPVHLTESIEAARVRAENMRNAVESV